MDAISTSKPSPTGRKPADWVPVLLLSLDRARSSCCNRRRARFILSRCVSGGVFN